MNVQFDYNLVQFKFINQLRLFCPIRPCQQLQVEPLAFSSPPATPLSRESLRVE